MGSFNFYRYRVPSHPAARMLDGINQPRLSGALDSGACVKNDPGVTPDKVIDKSIKVLPYISTEISLVKAETLGIAIHYSPKYIVVSLATYARGTA